MIRFEVSKGIFLFDTLYRLREKSSLFDGRIAVCYYSHKKQASVITKSSISPDRKKLQVCFDESTHWVDVCPVTEGAYDYPIQSVEIIPRVECMTRYLASSASLQGQEALLISYGIGVNLQ